MNNAPLEGRSKLAPKITADGAVPRQDALRFESSGRGWAVRPIPEGMGSPGGRK